MPENNVAKTSPESLQPGRRIYADQMIATAMAKPEIFERLADALTSTAEMPPLLPENNPLVGHARERMELEAAQFGQHAQVLAEFVTNGLEARRSSEEPVDVHLTVGDSGMAVRDNGKGLRLAEYLKYFYRFHTGEEGKIRGQFGQGTKSRWELLQPNQGIIEVASVAQSDGSFFRLREGRDEKGRLWFEVIDFGGQSEEESGLTIGLGDTTVANPHLVAAEVTEKLTDVDYGRVFSNGELINEKAVTARHYGGENGAILIISKEKCNSAMNVRVNVRGENVYDDSFSDEKKDRLVIDLSKKAMKAEARSGRHVVVGELDRAGVLNSVDEIIRDETIEKNEKVHILAALSRSFTFLQKQTDNVEVVNDITRHLAARLVPLIEETNMGVVEAHPGASQLDWGDQVVLIDTSVIAYMPKSVREKTRQTARGFVGTTALLEAPIKGGLDGSLLVQVNGDTYINRAMLEGEAGEERARAEAINTLIKLRNQRFLESGKIDGEFGVGVWESGQAAVAEAQEIWPAGIRFGEEGAKIEITVAHERKTKKIPKEVSSERMMWQQIEEEARSHLEEVKEGITRESLLREGEEILKNRVIETSGVAESAQASEQVRSEVLDKFFGFNNGVADEWLGTNNWEHRRSLGSTRERVKQSWVPILNWVESQGEQGRDLARLVRATTDWSGGSLRTLLTADNNRFVLENIFCQEKTAFFQGRDGWQAAVNLVTKAVNTLNQEELLLFQRANLDAFAERYFSTGMIDVYSANRPVAEYYDQAVMAEMAGKWGWFGHQSQTEVRQSIQNKLASRLLYGASENPKWLSEMRPDEQQLLGRWLGWFTNKYSGKSWVLSHALEGINIATTLHKNGVSLVELTSALEFIESMDLDSPPESNEHREYWGQFISRVVELGRMGEITPARQERLAGGVEAIVQVVAKSERGVKVGMRTFGNDERDLEVVRLETLDLLLSYFALPDESWNKEIRSLVLAAHNGEVGDGVNWSYFEGLKADSELVARRQKVLSRYVGAQKLLTEVSNYCTSNISYLSTEAQRSVVTQRFQRALEVVEFLCSHYPSETWENKTIYGWDRWRINGSASNGQWELEVKEYIQTPQVEVGDNWLANREVTSYMKYDLVDQAAAFVAAQAEGRELNWETLQELTNSPTEEMKTQDKKWLWRDISSAIQSQGGGMFRFVPEWIGNSMNISTKLPENERQVMVATGVDQNNRRYAQVIDFGGMSADVAAWSLETVGFTLGEKPEGSIARFRQGWLTCLHGAQEVRVRTSVGDGKVMYARYIPQRNDRNELVGVEVEKAIVRENSDGFSEMTWFGQSGIETWVKTPELTRLIDNSGMYFKPEELQVIKVDNGLGITSEEISSLKGELLSANQNEIMLGQRKIKLKPLNKTVIVGDRLNEWEIRLWRKQDEARPPLIQRGFRIGDEMPQGLQNGFPEILQKTFTANGYTWGLAVDSGVLLNKARDRVAGEENFVSASLDRVTVQGLRATAKMIALGQLCTDSRVTSLLSDDFYKEFAARSSVISKQGLGALDSLREGEIPNLSWLRGEGMDREVTALVVNLPIVESGIDGLPNFSIANLVTLRAGVRLLVEGRLPAGMSIYEAIAPLVKVGANGEVSLSNEAILLLEKHTRLGERMMRKLAESTPALTPLLRFGLRVHDNVNKKVNQMAKKVVNARKNMPEQQLLDTLLGHKMLWDRFAMQAAQTVSGSAGQIAQEIVRTAAHDPVALVPWSITAFFGLSLGGAGFFYWLKKRKEGGRQIGIGGSHTNEFGVGVGPPAGGGEWVGVGKESSRETTKEMTPTAVSLSERDFTRVVGESEQLLKDLSSAVRDAKTDAERKAIQPTRFIGEKQFPDAEVYAALSNWTSRVLKLAFGVDVDPRKRVGFHLEENVGGSHALARGGNGYITFNLYQSVGEMHAKNMKKVIEGEDHVLLGEVLGEIPTHEGRHYVDDLDPDNPDIVLESTNRTHDPTFHNAVYEAYEKVVQQLFKREEDGRLALVHEAQALRDAFQPTLVPGSEFYARLAAGD